MGAPGISALTIGIFFFLRVLPYLKGKVWCERIKLSEKLFQMKGSEIPSSETIRIVQ